MAIKIDEDQVEVSKLLDNLNYEVMKIEASGGYANHLYITQASEYDEQTHATVYYDSDKQFDDYDEPRHMSFKGEGDNATVAYLAANTMLVEWLDENKPGSIYDIKFDFYVGKEKKDAVIANIFFE